MPDDLKLEPPDSLRRPLVVDLDDALLRADLRLETCFAYLAANPLRLFTLCYGRGKGMAANEALAAQAARIDAAHLPYDDRVIAAIKQARASGRRTYLASANDKGTAAAIAGHLGLFDGCLVTAGSTVQAKAAQVTAELEDGPFDYLAGSDGTLSIWSVSGPAVSGGLSIAPSAAVIGRRKTSLRSWIRLLRVHQWAKNLLVFLPLVAAHKLELDALVAATCAFAIFCVAASAIYIINDVADLDADRRHPTKKRRPLAAGDVPIRGALALAPIMLALSVLSATALGYQFCVVLIAYVLLTTAYTFFLKKKMMVDVVTLASLYTLRVVGGAAAVMVVPSEWLLGFSMCIFTCLALVKRYIELATRIDADLPDAANRNYKKSDGAIVAALAAGSGFNAVTILALYISSAGVRQLYAGPELLWLICPILVYWIGRVLLMAHRRLMDDDPVVFAMKDPNSLLAAVLIGAILLAAKWGPDSIPFGFESASRPQLSHAKR